MFLKSFPERDETETGLALCRLGPRSNLVHDALCTLKSHGTYRDNSLASRYSPVELVHRVISRRHTAVGQLADFQGGPSRTGSNDEHI